MQGKQLKKFEAELWRASDHLRENSSNCTCFKDALAKYYNGELDRLTLEMLGRVV